MENQTQATTVVASENEVGAKVKPLKPAPIVKKPKTPKVKPAQPEYKTLTVVHDKTNHVFKALLNGVEYKEADCPRQCMMQLAHDHKPQQVLYFRGKKWRRKNAPGTVETVVSKTVVEAQPNAIAPKKPISNKYSDMYANTNKSNN